MNKKRLKEALLTEINTLRDQRGFVKAGLPRFDRLFGRDSLIVAWQLLNSDPSICQATIKILSELQGKKFDRHCEEEPGKILHETDDKPHPEYPDKIPFPYYGSADSTPLFVVILAKYIEETGDKSFLRESWPNIKAALDWIIKHGDADGDTFVEYERKGQGLFHQGWKDSLENHLKIKPPVAIVEVQGYAYCALEKGVFFSQLLGKESNQDQYQRFADELKERFNHQFWMEKEGFFALALDGDKNQKRVITSNPGHLLFTGIVKEELLKPLVKRLFEPDLWTPYGIRTHSTKEGDFDPLSYHLGSIWFHDNWIIAQGLKEIGATQEYRKIKNACHPQAWASAAILNLLSEE